ncbi:MAG TPA: hypothetical protein VNR39_12245 [Pseudolabrys sp.]|nr:hypothetical protein [Pseudolabrys sp.]
MKLMLVSGIVAATFVAAAVTEANAWTRNGSVTTARGTYTAHASGSCAGGTCTRTRSVTGPNGKTVTQSGSATRTGPHRYRYTQTTTGPNGGSVTRSGRVVSYPYGPHHGYYIAY